MDEILTVCLNPKMQQTTEFCVTFKKGKEKFLKIK